MADKVIEGTVAPVPPDDLPANEVHGPAGLASREVDASFLFEGVDSSGQEMSDNYRAIIEQILNADTPEQILTPIDIMQPRDVVGRALRLFDVRWQVSEFEVGSPKYASIECQDLETGQPMVINCGQKPVMAQMLRLSQLKDGLPQDAFFRVTGQNSFGTDMYRLTIIPKESQEVPF
jgi:hypothetical protein